MNFLQQKPRFQEMSIWSSDCGPQTIDEIIGNEEIKYTLKKYLEANDGQGHIPDILFTGNHGTNKRTFAKLLAESYLGEMYSRGCLSKDGAVCRGKDAISSGPQKKAADKTNFNELSVSEFTKMQVSLDGKMKIIIIYNFENMTEDAQNALRRIMETYARTTRFILVCNNLDKIIEAIQSRCVPLRTNLLSAEETKTLISTLLQKKHLPPLSPDIVKVINILSDGDCKKIINYVQTISVIPDITIDKFHRIFNVPPIKLLEQMLADTRQRKTQPRVIERITFLLNQGYNYGDIIEILSKILAYCEGIDGITENLRMLYLEELSKNYCEMNLYTSNVHLYSLFAKFGEIAVKIPK